MRKRITSLFVVLCMVLTFIPCGTVAAVSTFSGGSGSSEAPYLISSADDFIQLAADVNSGTNYKNVYFRQTCDVDLSGTEFVPIGNSDNNFSGTFDGGNFTTTLAIESDGNYAGMFGCTNNATLKNITTAGSVSGARFVGGVVGYLDGYGARVINCKNLAAVEASDSYVGGVVGCMGNSGQLFNCSNAGGVTGTKSGSIGGVCGSMSSSNAYAYNCYNSGNVTYTGDTAPVDIGGIAGCTYSSCYIKNCVNSGVVRNGGALVGRADVSDSKCFNNYYVKNDDEYGVNVDMDKNAVTSDPDEIKTVTREELFTAAGLLPLNMQVKQTESDGSLPDGISLLYWTVSGEGVISLVAEEPELPLIITNNSENYITVVGYEQAGRTVEVVCKELSSLTVTGITVTDEADNSIDTQKTENGYTFTMPEGAVSVSAAVKINLTETGGIYQIGSAEDMIILSDAAELGFDTTDKIFALTKDISLATAEGFSPIGTGTNPFSGTFDGGNHTIDLDIRVEENWEKVGIFGYIGNSVIRNIRTTGSVVAAGSYSDAGAVAAKRQTGNPIITNCHNEAAVTASEYVGGIIGDGNSSKLYNCSNSGTITLTYTSYSAGGIAGSVNYAYNCSNSGRVAYSIEENATFKGYTGGITGYAWNGYIKNCVNSGEISDGGAIVGNAGGTAVSIAGNYYVSGTASFGIRKNPDGTEATADVESRTKSVEKEVLFTEEGILPLNQFVMEAESDIKLLHWIIADGDIKFADEEIGMYKITNSSQEHLEVEDVAMEGKTITVTCKDVMGMKVTGVYAEDEMGRSVAAVKTENGYTFTMPEGNVTVSAELEINLTETDGVYQINSAADMIILSDAVSFGFDTTEKSFALTNDITLKTEDGFNPAGTEDKPFSGTFDGGNHTITLDIELTEEGARAGVFGEVSENVKLKNIRTEGTVSATGLNSYAGGIVAKANRGSVIISNCHNSASVTASDYAGGIAGDVSYGTTFNCSNSGDVVTALYRGRAGGIAGSVYYAFNCYNSGSVTYSIDESETFDGRIGGIAGSTWNPDIQNCVNSGAVVDGGGICGESGGDMEDTWGNYYVLGTAPLGIKFTSEGEAIEADDERVTKPVARAELFTRTGLAPLNAYSRDESTVEYDYFYWVLTGEGENLAIEFTTDEVEAPYSITGKSEYITVSEYAMADDTVTFTVTQPTDHEFIDSITGVRVNVAADDSLTVEVTEAGDNTYTFTMPEADVEISAQYKYRELEKDEDGVYIIGSASELYLFSLIADSNNTAACAKVVADEIDAREFDISIGRNSDFEGTFDGNGAVITTTDALFYRIKDATIKNIKAVVTEAQRAGLVVYSCGDSVIDNCTVDVIFTGEYAGGIAHDTTNNTVITNCIVSAAGECYAFGGIVCYSHDNTVVANCILQESDIESSGYGGIVCNAYGSTEIYNCMNDDMADMYNCAGGIIKEAAKGVISENNFYLSDSGYGINEFYDIYYDYSNDEEKQGMTDKNSALSADEHMGLYPAAKLNRYIEENPDAVNGVALNKWSVYYIEEYGPYMCFADDAHKEVYSLTYSNIMPDTMIYGALAGDEVTFDIHEEAEITVTDENGNEVTVTDGTFTMPEGDVTVDITMDTGIEETKEIDGKTYVVIKTGEDLVKAASSVAKGNNTLNIWIENDIVLTQGEISAYPPSDGQAPMYNGIFDGNYKTITLADSLCVVSNIGESGIIKNLTVDGVSTGFSSFAMQNNGTIMNCINNSDISNAEIAAGFAVINYGTIINCVNNGDMEGGYAAAICGMNGGRVEMCASAAEIIATNDAENRLVAVNEGSLFNNITADESADYLAAMLNRMRENAVVAHEVMEKGSYYISDMNREGLTKELLAQLREWSAEDESTIVYADDTNKPYYTFLVNNQIEAHKAGEEVAFDAAGAEDGFEINGVKVVDLRNNEITVTKSAENTYTFTMPEGMCKAITEIVPITLEREVSEDGRTYYLIDDIDDFNAFAQTVNAGSTTVNAKLTADIEDAYTGEPIGSSYNPYMGIFDGNGHSINLDMADSYCDHYGLFGGIDTIAAVKNLTTKGSVKMSNDESDSFVGAVAGLNNGTIINCTNEATVSGDCYVGGIAGKNASVASMNKNFSVMMSVEEEISGTGIIMDCVNNADIDGYYIGGIAGCMENGNDGFVVGDNTAVIEGCINNGEITGYSLGGIVARACGTADMCVLIRDCVNNGAVTGEYECGGIAKEIEHAVVNNCINNGDVYIDEQNAGGISGDSEENIVIMNCVNNGDVRAVECDAGGIIGDCEDGTEIINCINNGEVETPRYAGGIVGAAEDALMIKYCYNGAAVLGNEFISAIANHEAYDEENEEEVSEVIVIEDTYYLKTDSVNTYVPSSNIPDDTSEAADAEMVSCGEVSYKLNRSNSEDEELRRWSVADGAVIFADEDNGLVCAITIDEEITNGSLVVVGGNYAKCGTEVKLDVVPDEGYVLSEITGAEVDENNSFTMPEEDITISAVFKPTFEGTDKSDIIRLTQKTAMENVKLADYVKFTDENVADTFTFALADGSTLPDGITLADGVLSGTPMVYGEYTVVFDVTADRAELFALNPGLATDNAQLTLTFDIAEAIYKVNIVGAENGSITADKQTAKKGEKVTLTITPAKGYELLEIKGVEVDESYSFTMPANDVAIGAVFKLKDYSITIGETTNGTVTADRQTAKMGDKVTLTVTPAKGYVLSEITGVAVDENNTFTMPANDVTIGAVFVTETVAEKTYTITVAETANGSVKADKQTAKVGERITLTITPDVGYELSEITGVTADENNSFIMPANDVTVNVVFTLTDYSVTVTEAENGSVTADKQTAKMGDKVTLTITPDVGYKLSEITGAEVDENNSFTMPADNVTISAVFTAEVYSIAIAEAENGSIRADRQTAKMGDKVTLMITPDVGYELSEITGVTLDENNSFTMPADDVTIGAVFTLKDYSITITEAENGSVTADKQTAKMGDKVTLTITPSEGYVLSEITGAAVDENNSFTMPADDVTIGAVFVTETVAEKTYTITIAEAENGSVTADKLTAKAGDKVTLTITPADGYELSEITGVEVDANNTFTMPARDVMVDAVFAEIPKPVTEAYINGEIGEDGKQIIRYAVPEGVEYNLIVVKYSDNGSAESIKITASVVDLNNGELVIDSGEKVKVMLWSDLTTMRPLCKGYSNN